MLTDSRGRAKRRRRLHDQEALQPVDRPFSHCGVWGRFILAVTLAILAFAARTPMTLLWLGGANLLFLWLHRPGRSFLRKAAKTAIWQTALITVLYGLRYDFATGLAPGLISSGQLCLAWLPGSVFVEVVPGYRIVRMLSDVIPYRMAFVMATCINFVPLLLAETKTIYEGQVLRGARILPRDLVRPWHWPELLHCLVVPVMIRSMALAQEIAIAARARDFGLLPRRTYWPGERE